MSVVIEVRDLVQEYPGVKALKGVSLEMRAGEVLGLVGENGAGKSTLIRMLAGIESPVSGTILVNGDPVAFRNSSESQSTGISVVSQEFRLVPQLSIADNIFLGHELGRGPAVDHATTRKRASDVLDTLGLHLDSRRMVGSLPVGDQQLVEISRALSREFHTLILDEPTAALNKTEVDQLLGIVRRLAAQGKSVLYVSHHLEEIFRVCDRVAVLRDGQLVAVENTPEIDEAALVEHMLGRKPENFSKIAGSEDDDRDLRLEVKDLKVLGFERTFDLSARRGEVLGLAGLVGSGRTEITRALFGSLPHRGIVMLDGIPVETSSPTAAIKSGFFMLSEDRKSEGILPHLDVTENATVSRDKVKTPWLQRIVPSRRVEAGLFQRLRNDMRIRVPHGRQLIGNLSGGNQQKVLFGRATLSGCRVLLLNEPTRGVDVGAKIEIYELIKQLSEDGVTVIVSSSDVPELVSISDRCLVYFSGELTAELVGDQISEDAIVAASVGQRSAA